MSQARNEAVEFITKEAFLNHASRQTLINLIEAYDKQTATIDKQRLDMARLKSERDRLQNSILVLITPEDFVKYFRVLKYVSGFVAGGLILNTILILVT